MTNSYKDVYKFGFGAAQFSPKQFINKTENETSQYINKHVVEPGGTISPCGKNFQNLIGGGKFFLHYRGG